MSLNITNRVAKLEGAASATAKGLLRDNTIKVVTAGLTAQWDYRSRELHVPAFSMRDDDDPALIDAWRGTLDHECGHVENTDMELVEETLGGWKKTYGDEAEARMFRLWNMFEDPRQEALWGATRPGSAGNLRRMHDWYVAQTPAAHDPATQNAQGEAIGVWEALCQSVIRLKLGHLTFADCHPVVQSILVLCEEQVRAGWRAATTEDTLSATESVWKKLLDEQEKQEEEQEQEQPGLDMPQPPKDDDDENDAGEGGDSDAEADGEDGDEDGAGPGDCDDDGEEGDNDAEGSEGTGEDSEDDGEEGDNDAEGSDDGDEGDNGDNGDNGDEGDNDAEDPEGGGDAGDTDGECQEGDAGPSGPMMGLDGNASGEVDLGGADGVPSFDMGADDGDCEEDDGEAVAPNTTRSGVGMGDQEYTDPLANAVGGDFAELDGVGDLVASTVLSDPSRRPYTVHPNTRRQDMVKRYDADDRRDGLTVLPGLRAASKGASSILGNTLRDVVAATKQTLWVGSLEDGEHLDMDALPGVALGLPDQAIFGDYFRQTDDNVFVVVVTDCSGSMGDSSPTKYCSVCGHTSGSKSDKCHRRTWKRGRDVKCGGALTFKVASKAGYAAVLSMALHDALRLTEVPHAILGYNAYRAEATTEVDDDGYTVYAENPIVGKSPACPDGYPLWSRYRSRTVLHEFVPAPGLGDNGSALPFITGGGWNSDGDSLREAALYAAKHAADKDRIVMIVACDGYPCGADDHDMNKPYLTQTVEEIAQAGIEVYGFGIGMNESDFEGFYPNRSAGGGRAATGNVCLDRKAQGLSAAVLMRLCRIIGQSVGFSRSVGR